MGRRWEQRNRVELVRSRWEQGAVVSMWGRWEQGAGLVLREKVGAGAGVSMWGERGSRVQKLVCGEKVGEGSRGESMGKRWEQRSIT